MIVNLTPIELKYEEKVKVIVNLTPKELIYRGKSESDCELNTDSIEI